MTNSGRVVLVTGGARGIGRATAERFLEAGDRVAIADLNQVEGLVGDVLASVVDVTRRDQVDAWVEQVMSHWGRIDVLINNAGVVRDAQLVRVKEGQITGQMPEADFDLVLAVNLKGVFHCTQAVAPVMIRQGSGVMLNASSVVGLDGNFGQTNYVASKAGVVGMTRVWARELGRHGIRVNAVAPGFIATDMALAIPDKVLAAMEEHTPLRRLGHPRDVANAYWFLASEQAGFITGAVLRVDGGLVVGS